jgi:hypothetical protein
MPAKAIDPLRLLPAWRRNDAEMIKAAIDFWTKSHALPPGVTPEQRAQQLCALTYVRDEVVGVSTIELGCLPTLPCRLGFFRCLVSPAHPHRRIARRLTIYSRKLLELWSKDNPKEKILGMAAVLENPNFDLLATWPIWRAANLLLIGYNAKGQQIRLSWFDHARLERVGPPQTAQT